jgi:ribonuclease J
MGLSFNPGPNTEAKEENCLKISIHRGSKEIGGTCIELATSQTKILVDLGAPLSKNSQSFDPKSLKVDAVLISHPHQDHYGLIEQLDEKTPVYIGALGKSLIDATRIFLKRELPANNFIPFTRSNTFTVGDFTITPYLVDHSAVDAYAFLVEAEGKRLFYSGDFRAHGRKSVLFERMIKNPPADIDLLFLEGTMLRRDNSEFPSEEAVQNKISALIRNQENMSFLLSSSQNIDRLVSAYKACIVTGKTLVLDIYTAWVLELMNQVTRNVPDMSWDLIKVYTSNSQYQTMKASREYFGSFANRVWDNRVTMDELENRPADYLFFGKMSHFKTINRFKEQGGINLIYSQWQGYLKYSSKDYFGAEEIAALKDDPQVDFTYAHTSGHATLEDLQSFARAINPRALVPIHTEFADDYTGHFDNVVSIEDGTPYDCCSIRS